MRKATRKSLLFKHYRKNIELLCENPNYNRNALKDIVVCPICVRAFAESDLRRTKGKSNFLTIEHVPPGFLGGKTEVLTCFECNNAFSDDDKELNFYNNKSDETIFHWRSKLKLDEGIKFGAITKFDSLKKEFNFTLSGMDDLRNLINSIKVKAHNEFKVEMKNNGRAVGANILKIAYLFAFNKFGYGLILQPQYDFIRQQIIDPYSSALDNFGVVEVGEDLTLPEGVFIVKEPKEFVSLLVRFSIVKIDGNINRYSVFLPSPSVDVVRFYERLGAMAKGTKFIVSDFANLDYWHDPRFNYAPIHEVDQILRKSV